MTAFPDIVFEAKTKNHGVIKWSQTARYQFHYLSRIPPFDKRFNIPHIQNLKIQLPFTRFSLFIFLNNKNITLNNTRKTHPLTHIWFFFVLKSSFQNHKIWKKKKKDELNDRKGEWGNPLPKNKEIYSNKTGIWTQGAKWKTIGI